VDATFIRFVINGLVATAAHYLSLVFLIELIGVGSAGLANGLAAMVGITVSYLGNSKHVFRSEAGHSRTFPRFLGVYAMVAVVHGFALALWTDYFEFSYHLGFVIATALAVALTFFGNKRFVFRQVSRDTGASLRDGQGGAIRGADGRD
jgi:putative flippase GtrA